MWLYVLTLHSNFVLVGNLLFAKNIASQAHRLFIRERRAWSTLFPADDRWAGGAVQNPAAAAGISAVRSIKHGESYNQ
jgi:hypothetical protein